MHRDLKLENIFLRTKDSLTDLKIGDFGLANLLQHPSEKKKFDGYGTLYILPPEALVSDDADVGAPFDVWALGVVLFVLLCGRLPFTAAGSTLDPDTQPADHIVRAKIIAGTYDMDRTVEPAAADLVRWMLKTNPAYRATLSEIQAHPWLADDEEDEDEDEDSEEGEDGSGHGARLPRDRSPRSPPTPRDGAGQLPSLGFRRHLPPDTTSSCTPDGHASTITPSRKHSHSLSDRVPDYDVSASPAVGRRSSRHGRSHSDSAMIDELDKVLGKTPHHHPSAPAPASLSVSASAHSVMPTLSALPAYLSARRGSREPSARAASDSPPVTLNRRAEDGLGRSQHGLGSSQHGLGSIRVGIERRSRLTDDLMDELDKAGSSRLDRVGSARLDRMGSIRLPSLSSARKDDPSPRDEHSRSGKEDAKEDRGGDRFAMLASALSTRKPSSLALSVHGMTAASIDEKLDKLSASLHHDPACLRLSSRATPRVSDLDAGGMPSHSEHLRRRPSYMETTRSSNRKCGADK
jgi:serine/threonine protein kinase